MKQKHLLQLEQQKHTHRKELSMKEKSVLVKMLAEKVISGEVKIEQIGNRLNFKQRVIAYVEYLKSLENKEEKQEV